MKKIVFNFLMLISSLYAEVIVSEDWLKDQIRPAIDSYVTWGNYDLSFSGQPPTPTLSVNGIEEIETEVIRKSYNPNNQVFFVLLSLKNAQGIHLTNVSLRGRVVAMADIPVLTRPIGPGETIKAEDITHIRMPAVKINAATIRDQGNLIAHQPRFHLLHPGKPILDRDVTLPVMVPKGSLATVVYKTGSMTLTARAIAQQNGAKGETIQFIRSDMKAGLGQKPQSIFAKVVSEGIAEIVPVSHVR